MSSFQLVSIVLNFKFLYFSLLSQDSSVSEKTEYGQDDQSSVSDMDRNISLCHHIQTDFKICPTSLPVDLRNHTGIQQKLNIHFHLVLQSTVLYAFAERRLNIGYFWTAQNSSLLYPPYCSLLSVSPWCSISIFKI